MGRATKTIPLGVAIATVLAIFAGIAYAELTARGDLFVKFNGGIAPGALPRETKAPISVYIDGTVRTLSGERPPALRQISIAINRGGRLNAEGLPICRQREIEPSTTEQALGRCRTALVGRGRYSAAMAFPEQGAFPTNGAVLAFNTVIDGQRAILAHVYGADPVPITRIIVFHIRESPGTFRTVLTGFLPPSINRYGYVKRISLNLHRIYRYRGKLHSYLSAACAAPIGFGGAAFPFAHASMTFEDNRTLSSILTRSCRVRD